MRVHIDYNSSEPIYRQAVEQIKALIVSGQLAPGAKIPSIRELARDLRINPTTAAKIYTELEHAGLLALRQGQGAFVTVNSPVLAPKEIRRRLGKQARSLVVEGLRFGLTKEAIQEVVAEEFEHITRGKS